MNEVYFIPVFGDFPVKEFQGVGYQLGLYPFIVILDYSAPFFHHHGVTWERAAMRTALNVVYAKIGVFNAALVEEGFARDFLHFVQKRY